MRSQMLMLGCVIAILVTESSLDAIAAEAGCKNYRAEVKEVQVSIPLSSGIPLDDAFFELAPPVLTQDIQEGGRSSQIKADPEYVTVKDNVLHATYCQDDIVEGRPLRIAVGPKWVVIGGNDVVWQAVGGSGRLSFARTTPLAIDWSAPARPTLSRRDPEGDLQFELAFLNPAAARIGPIDVRVERYETVCRSGYVATPDAARSGQQVEVSTKTNGGPEKWRRAMHFDAVRCGPGEEVVFQLDAEDIETGRPLSIVVGARIRSTTAELAPSAAAMLMSQPRQLSYLRMTLKLGSWNVFPEVVRAAVRR